MKIIFCLISFLPVLFGLSVYSQDTTIYKKEYSNKFIDTCVNKIVYHWVGCGHPEHYVLMCDGHKMEKLEIYNRWGEIVYITTDQFHYIELRDKNGALLREDSYLYRIKYRTLAGELKTSTGQFTFIP